MIISNINDKWWNLYFFFNFAGKTLALVSDYLLVFSIAHKIWLERLGVEGHLPVEKEVGILCWSAAQNFCVTKNQ